MKPATDGTQEALNRIVSRVVVTEDTARIELRRCGRSASREVSIDGNVWGVHDRLIDATRAAYWELHPEHDRRPFRIGRGAKRLGTR